MASRGDDDQVFAGMRSRKLAKLFDSMIILIILVIEWAILLVILLALGVIPGYDIRALEWPHVFALVMLCLSLVVPTVFFYYCLSISGPDMATPGMMANGLEIRMADGSRVTFLIAVVHSILIFVCRILLLELLFSMFSADKRSLPDIIAGVVVTRRL